MLDAARRRLAELLAGWARRINPHPAANIAAARSYMAKRYGGGVQGSRPDSDSIPVWLSPATHYPPERRESRGWPQPDA